MVLAESDFDCGEIGERELKKITAQYDKARAALLSADLAARVELV